MSMKSSMDIDVLVIGAGPSGAVAAAYLQQQGFDVKVVEKSQFPRFVIGESLLPRCMDHFEEVGFLDCLNKQGFEIKRGARFVRNGKAFEIDFADNFTDGYHWTWQVPRAHFDKTLTDELQRRGVAIQFDCEVVDVKIDAEGRSVSSLKHHGKLSELRAKFIIDSSGFGRVLPRLLDLDAPSKIPEHASLFTHVKDSNRPEGKEGTQISFDVLSVDTWLWVIPFSDGTTSIGVVGPNAKLTQSELSLIDQLRQWLDASSHFKDRFKDQEFLFEPKMISTISKSVKKLYGKGFALTGNSAEFLDPVFSSGVTFATESGLLAAKLCAKHLQRIAVDWETDYSQYIKQGVNVFSTYVKEWYTGNLQTIFFDSEPNPVIKRQICSVLAGYVWDTSNPFVSNHERIIKTLAKVVHLGR